MPEPDYIIEVAPQQRDDIARAIDAMRALDLIDRATIFVGPLLNDAEETNRAIAMLLGAIRVLSMRLSDQERSAICMQMIEEARRVLAGWIH